MKRIRTQILAIALVMVLLGTLVPDTVYAAQAQAVQTDASGDAQVSEEADASDDAQETEEETTYVTTTTVDENGEVLESTTTTEAAVDSVGTEDTSENTDDTGADTDGTGVDTDGTGADTDADDGSDSAADTQKTLTDTTTTYTMNITVKTTAVSSKNKCLKKITISKPKLIKTVTKTWSDGSTETTETTSTYSLTVKYSIRGTGWVKATKNAAGTSYVCKAAKAADGAYIQAIKITPSDTFKAALKKAGLTFCYRVKTSYFGTMGWAKAGQNAGSTGCSNPMTSLTIKAVTTDKAKTLDTEDRYIRSTSVYYKTKDTGSSSWSSKVKNASTSGTKSASASIGSISIKLQNTDSAFAYSGSIKYSVRTSTDNSSKKWSAYVSNGKTAGSKNAGIQAIKIKLTGEMAEKYDIYYRVYVGNYGWLDWAKNNQKAGTEGIGLAIGAIQIKLVPKGKSISGDTEDHYIDSISGDKTLDGYLTKIYKKKGTNLRTLYNYVASYKYIRYYVYPKTSTWKTWSIEYAKDMYEKQGGNCYRYASLFCWLARGLGYDARVMTGYVPSRSRGWAPHGWVEIKENGTTYIYDPDLYHDHPTRNWYRRTYSNAPTTYKRSYA